MTNPKDRSAKIYRRINGGYGASCDGCLDTGYDIREHKGKFTVHTDDGVLMAFSVSRAKAERVITEDWRKPL